MSDGVTPTSGGGVAPEAQWEKLRSAANALRCELAKRLDHALPVDCRPEAHLQAAVTAIPRRYSSLSDEFSASCERLRRVSSEALRDSNRYVFASLLADFDLSAIPCVIPPSVRPLYLRELGRVLNQLQAEDARYQDVFKDSQRKDFAIMTGRLIPIGAEFAALDGGIPRSMLFRGGAGQFLRLSGLVARSGGFRSWLELHTHLDSLIDFSPQGWHDSYLKLADLLSVNPRWHGFMAASWFRDPALAEISPHLTYLRSVPMAGGASLLFVQLDLTGDSGALHRSQKRRQLFAEGRYVPAIYMLVWPRRELLAWAARQKTPAAR